ncbi:MAG: preprotein translocase subunit SecE [Candidatus Saccharimonadales bacterium]
MAKDTKQQDKDPKKGKSLTIREQMTGQQAKLDKKAAKAVPGSSKTNSNAKTKGKKANEEKTFWQAFWWGFLLPLRWIWKVVSIILWPLFWLLKHIIPVKYFVGSWQELRQVTWPNMRDTLRLTLAVIIFSIVFGLLIAAVDYGIDKFFKQLILG